MTVASFPPNLCRLPPSLSYMHQEREAKPRLQKRPWLLYFALSFLPHSLFTFPHLPHRTLYLSTYSSSLSTYSFLFLVTSILSLSSCLLTAANLPTIPCLPSLPSPPPPVAVTLSFLPGGGAGRVCLTPFTANINPHNTGSWDALFPRAWTCLPHLTTAMHWNDQDFFLFF